MYSWHLLALLTIIEKHPVSSSHRLVFFFFFGLKEPSLAQLNRPTDGASKLPEVDAASFLKTPCVEKLFFSELVQSRARHDDEPVFFSSRVHR